MERAPRKKEKRPIPKGAVLLALALAAACAAALAICLRRAPAGTVIQDSPEQVWLLNRPREDVAFVETALREGEGFRLVRNGDGWALEGSEDVPLQEELLEQIMLSATEMSAYHTVYEKEDASAAEAFGLDAPAVTVRVGYADGEEKEIRFGDLSPEETPQRYAMLAGNGGLFTVLEAECDIFFQERVSLRDFRQPEINASLLDRVQVQGDVTLDLRAVSLGWTMAVPWHYPADTAKTNALLRKIEGMAFEACLGDAAELALADYGLDAPALTVTLTQAATVIRGESTEGEQVEMQVPETEYTLLLGDETGRSGVYLLWEGQVFKASNFLLGFWKELDAEAYLSRQPVDFPVNALTRVTYTEGGVSRAYRVAMVESVTPNNQIAADEYGRTLYEVEAVRESDGQTVDQAAFLRWYEALASLRPDGRLPEGFTSQGQAAASILLEAETGNREILFYPWDETSCALSVDGGVLFFVARDWLSQVRSVP